MKKKVVTTLSLLLALGVTAPAKNLSYEEERVQQYKQFYNEYQDKDYKIRKSETHELIDIIHGHNIHDNIRKEFSELFDMYLPQINKEYFNYKGADASWYFTPYKSKYESKEAIALEELAEEALPQVMKDILKLPEDLQKKIMSILYYPVDGDSWIIFKIDTEESVIKNILENLKNIDEQNDKNKIYDDNIKPIMPTENQLLPYNLFFPPIRYVDTDGDGEYDYTIELYCTDGTWFDPELEKANYTVMEWYEVKDFIKKYDKPSRITIDFDIGKEYEHQGFDIEFYDKDLDGYFENYEIKK